MGRFATGHPGRSFDSEGVELIVGISGVMETIKSLKGFHPTLQKKLVRKAIRKAAKPVLEAAKARAAVDSGAMEESLKLRAAKRSRKSGVVGMSVLTGTRAELGIAPDDRYYYPSVVEYGSAKRNIPMQPFLRTAKDDAGSEVYRVYRNALMTLIDETASQLYHGKINEKGVKVKGK